MASPLKEGLSYFSSPYVSFSPCGWNTEENRRTWKKRRKKQCNGILICSEKVKEDLKLKVTFRPCFLMKPRIFHKPSALGHNSSDLSRYQISPNSFNKRPHYERLLVATLCYTYIEHMLMLYIRKESNWRKSKQCIDVRTYNYMHTQNVQYVKCGCRKMSLCWRR